MKKRLFTTLLVLSTLGLNLASCGSNEVTPPVDDDDKKDDDIEEKYVPKNDLEELLQKMQSNNFSVEVNLSSPSTDYLPTLSKFRYTEYSVEKEGGVDGFMGVGKDNNEVVFKYSISDDNEIECGGPLIDSTSGSRYNSVYDRICGFENFDISKISKTLNDDGSYYYYYEDTQKNEFHDFEVDTTNNDIINQVFFGHSSGSQFSASTMTWCAIDGEVIIDCKGESYTQADGSKKYTTYNVRIYDIGKTENETFKKFIDSGKGAKEGVDARFFRVINPYLYTNNYEVEIDASGLKESFRTSYNIAPETTLRFTEDAFEVDRSDTSTRSGFFLACGVAVTNYTTDGGKITIGQCPVSDASTLDFYSSLYGGYRDYSTEDLYFDLFNGGYIDENNTNLYYFSDSQLLSMMTYLAGASISDNNYADKISIEITDESKNEFKMSVDYYNRSSGEEYGTYVATFTNINGVSIPEVEAYLFKGDDASTQDKNELKKVLELFKGNNYSFDAVLEGVGVVKYYLTENYFFEEAYNSIYGTESNIGYFKNAKGNYVEFSIANDVVTVAETTDFGGTIPSIIDSSSIILQGDDLGYLSTIDDALFDVDAYEVATFDDMTYWKNTTSGFSQKVLNYILGSSQTSFLPLGAGVMVNYDEDDSDATRLTLVSTVVSSDGSYEASQTFTYYDIGSTHKETIENYLKNEGLM